MPFDRDRIARFRETFPRARFRRRDARWFVPGTTAEKRLGAWIDGERMLGDAHADAKGRDAYEFDPLESPYLEVGDDLTVRTPYSRTVIDTLRTLPPARWDPQRKAWRLPFRAYEALRAVWPVIEAAARRNEPDAKRRRAGDEGRRLIEAERRRRRYPVPQGDPPPLGASVSTLFFGIVTVEAIDDGPIIEAGEMPALGLPDAERPHVWGWWRPPTWRDLATIEPVEAVSDADRRRGWWLPTEAERGEARRRLRRTERATQAKSRSSATAASP
jgi:hypothetical protein